jgi:hypothetical protein
MTIATLLGLVDRNPSSGDKMGIKFFAAAFALFAAIAPASANVLEVTITGTVSSGTDVYGLFGVVGADMTGVQFTANYSVDLAGANVYIFDGGVRDLRDPWTLAQQTASGDLA